MGWGWGRGEKGRGGGGGRAKLAWRRGGGGAKVEVHKIVSTSRNFLRKLSRSAFEPASLFTTGNVWPGGGGRGV